MAVCLLYTSNPVPIKIPNQLPATETLTRENIFVMTETRALTQDIRPLRILLLTLMPTKVDTETQFARVLGNTPVSYTHLGRYHIPACAGAENGGGASGGNLELFLPDRRSGRTPLAD